jgi:hypothetical protein
VVADVAGLREALDAGPAPVYVTAKFPVPPAVEELLARRGTRIFSTLPPSLARVNLFDWVSRADMAYVWRVDRSTDGEPAGPGAPER